MTLPRVKLTIGEHPLDAYVARNAEERALGLMHRREMPENEGMLFMCDEPQPQSFWMKDTPLPLSIAFMDDDGHIVQIGDLEPHCEDAHTCETPVRYVLEVNQGWFSERGIAPGARIEGPLFIRA
ncbi:DUF192 domain-containing protein [Ramlibacter sp.]|uniref:DUF192 domain-containing protein n=1 Tax=Ramlibacter sp. TaxID=1917967 RepID=UPI003D14A0D3